MDEAVCGDGDDWCVCVADRWKDKCGAGSGGTSVCRGRCVCGPLMFVVSPKLLGKKLSLCLQNQLRT